MSATLRISVPAEHRAMRRWIGGVVGTRLVAGPVELVDGGAQWGFQQGERRWSTPAASPMAILDTSASWRRPVNLEGVPLWPSPLPIPQAAIAPTRTADEDATVLVGDVAWLDLAAALLAEVDELALHEGDAHGRVRASETWLGRAEGTDRPIVDEIVETLRAALCRAGFALAPRAASPRVAVSHDVDVPFIARPPGVLRTPRALRRALVGALGVPRRRAVAGVVRATFGNASADPMYTFDRLLQDHADAGRTATAYFLADAAHPLDARYRLRDPEIRALLRAWCAAGHRVGLHGGYATWRDGEALGRQLARLRATLSELGITAEEIGGRQHYLRWDPAVTPALYAGVGLRHDATLGFAERPGFRRGTCWPYPAFDVRSDRALALEMEPLHLMEVSVFAARYAGYAYDAAEAWAWIERLRAGVRSVGGVWSVLWHNTELVDTAGWTAYQRAIAPLA